MPTPLDRYIQFLRDAGVDFEVPNGLVRDDDHDGNLIKEGDRPRRFEDLADQTIFEWDDLAAGLGSDHASLGVAHELRRLGHDLKGKRVLELGCGTGLLAVQATLFGAEVVATDLDQEALELARRNAELNRVELDLRFGSLAEPIGEHEYFDLVIANLPHKPAASAHDLPLSQNGGPEGDSLFAALEPFFRRQMKPGSTLLFFMHSLPHPRLLRKLAQHFDLALRRWKLRYLVQGEYRNLMPVFRDRVAEGRSFLHEEAGREALVACIWEARRKEDDG